VSQIPVTISLSSIQEDGELKDVARHEYQGLLHFTAEVTYVRYEDAEGVSNTVRLASDGVRVYRRGGLHAWQDFRLGEVTGGGLSFQPDAQNGMTLRVRTHQLVFDSGPREGQLSLVYDLFTADSAADDADLMALCLGRFTLEMAWTTALTS
jgi:uncharacterized beta-barrel protein YwiB (DUF1934 family)